MKVKFIGDHKNFTKDKIYEVLNPGTKSPYYIIIDDVGYRSTNSKNYFLTIEEVREEKLNTILDES